MKPFILHALVLVFAVLGALTVRSFFITSKIQQQVGSVVFTSLASSPSPDAQEQLPNGLLDEKQADTSDSNAATKATEATAIPQVDGITTHVDTLQTIYDAQKGLERTLSINDKGLTFDVYKKAKNLIIDLREDGTKFSVRDHAADVLTIDNNKNIITHSGSTVDIRGAFKLDSSAGNSGEVLVSQGKGNTPAWKKGTTLTAGNLDCENCITDQQITDIYLMKTGGNLTGDVQLNAQTDLKFADSDSSHYVALQAPATVSASVVWTLPSADGSADQALTTNGSGTLSWATPATGDITAVGDCTSGACFEGTSGSTLTFTGTGTINGLDAIDSTTETTLEAALDIAGDISGTGLGSVTIGADKVLESHLKAVDAASDEECLTYESTTGDFEWESCTETGASLVTLAGTSGTNQAITVGDTITIGAGTGITTTGAATDTVTIAATLGTSIAASEVDADALDFTELQDTLDTDAALTINSTDTTADGITYTATSLTTGTALDVNATNTATTNTALEQVQFDLTNAQATAANTGFTGIAVNFTNNPTIAGNTERVLRVQNQVTANATDNAVAALLYLDNADTSTTGSTVVTDALLIQNTGNIAGGITNAINIDDTDVTTDIVLQNDETIDNDTDGTINLTATTVKVTGTTITGSGALTVLPGGAAGLTLGGASTTALTVTTDSTGTAEVVLPTGSIDSTEILDDTIAAADIAVDAVGSSEIAANAVDASELAATAVIAAAYGSATQVATFTVDADGRLTAASNTTIAGLTGSNIADDTLDFVDFEDTLDTDAALTINSTDTTADGITYTATSLTTGTALDVNATNTATTNTALEQVQFDLTNAQATAANTGFTGIAVNFSNNPTVAGNTERVLRVQNQATSNATDNAVAALLYLDNADTSTVGSTVVTDAILITNTGDIAAGITNAINIDDIDVTNDIVLQNDEVIHNNTDGTIAFTDGTNSLFTIVDDGTSGTASVTVLTLTNTGTLNGLDAIDATGEATLEATLDIAGDISGTGLAAVTIGADKVLESHLKAVDVAADEECLSYETTTGDFEWQSCGTSTPGGATTQVQFNTSGAFDGDAEFVWNTTTKLLTVTGQISASEAGTTNEGFGAGALASVQIGGNLNVALGYNALTALTTGDNNTGIGYAALTANTTASDNTGLGYNVLGANTTGFNNTAVGSGALDTNTTGSQNTAIGNNALTANTTAHNNTAVGYNVLATNTTGTLNTAIGASALWLNTTGGYNTAVGQDVLKVNTTGTQNTAIGTLALDANTTASDNTAAGYNVLGANTTGTRNTGVGASALVTSTTANDNTGLGYNVLNLNTGAANTAVGSTALDTNSSGVNNTAVGYAALTANTIGSQDVAIGVSALDANTEGANNVAIGYDAGGLNTTGSSNVFIGREAGDTATITDSNQFIAGSSLYALNNVWFGKGVVNASPTAYTINGTGGSGTDIAGAALQLAGGKATGNAAGGSIIFQTSDAGVTGTTLQTLTTKMTIDATGNVGVGTTSAGTACVSCIALASSTAPSASITDGIQLFAVDIIGSHELRVRDEAGNVTTLSPHNTSILSEVEEFQDRQEDYYLPWSYTSERDNQAINVDMYGAVQEVEYLSGKHFIYGKDIATEAVFTPLSF